MALLVLGRSDSRLSWISGEPIAELGVRHDARVLGNGVRPRPLSNCRHFPGYNSRLAFRIGGPNMAIMEIAKRSGRGLAVAAALVAAVSLTAVPGPAYAEHGGGGIGPGAAVGLGLGAFALGSALGAGAYGYPYYAPAYGYYPPAAYYPPAPGYYPPAPAPRSCWDPYYRRYYAC
jgi:hypothetical protein